MELTCDVGTGNKWKYELASVVARNYCCKVYYKGSERIIFYGYKSDIIIARRMFSYLFEVGCRLARTYSAAERERRGCAEGVYNSYCLGFIEGVKSQLEKQCTALALVVPVKVEEEYKEMSAGWGTVDSSLQLRNINAYYEGETEGKRALNSRYVESDENA